MKTKHNYYNSKLKTLSKHYANISEVEKKVQKWKTDFKIQSKFKFYYIFVRFYKLNKECSKITKCKSLRTQEVAVISSIIMEHENSRIQKVVIISSTVLFFLMYLVCFNILLPQFIKTNISKMHEIINKIDNCIHQLFKYRIIDLSNRNAVNLVNKIFTSTEIRSLKDFWDAIYIFSKNSV
jgi:hypothetical protein